MNNNIILPPYPRNEYEWWLILDNIWDDVLVIAQNVGCPLEQPAGENIAETWLQYITRLKSERSEELADFLEMVWDSAPDKPHIRKWKNWFRLCDLCSESHVLYPKDDDPDNVPF